MRIIHKHFATIVLVVFLAIVPVAAASQQGPKFTPAQGFNPDQFIQVLFTNGAELVYSSIDQDGVPAVVYAQLGMPSSELQLSSDMYDGCLVMALAGVHGQMLNYLLTLFGNISGSSGPLSISSFTPMQGTSTFNPNQLLGYLGTEFNLMIAGFLNLDQQVSAQRMSAIAGHLQTAFGFGFSPLFQLRVDQSLLPNITLPFTSLDLYIYQVTNAFGPLVDAVLSVMNQGGFLSSFNKTIFESARASGAVLVAIPDIAELLGLFNSTMGGVGPFALSQMPSLSGPIAVAAVGYIGDQVVSSTTTDLSIGSLIGATTFKPLSQGMSIVVANMPNSVPIVSYTPEHVNRSFYDNVSQLVLWNATAFGEQSDYVLHFTAGRFPPLITVQRVFSPITTGIGGQTLVTVTVTNKGTSPITNLNLTDRGFLGYYKTLNVSGTTSAFVSSLAPSETTSITYTVTFRNEGTYTFPGAVLHYTFNSTGYTKYSPDDGFAVTTSIGNVLLRMISDGMPVSGVIVALIALGGVWQVFKLVKRQPSAPMYQV